jgi:hypothetical protein
MSQIVKITHETGDLTEYTSTSVGAGQVLAADISARGDNTAWGLLSTINNANNVYARKDYTQLTGSTYKFAGWIDPTGLTMATSDNFYCMRFLDGGSGRGGIIIIKRENSFGVRVQVEEDGGGSLLTIFPAPQRRYFLEYHITRGNGNGEVKVWIDGVQRTLDDSLTINTVSRPDSIRVGGVSGINGGTSGLLKHDEIEVRDDHTVLHARNNLLFDENFEGATHAFDYIEGGGNDIDIIAAAAMSGSRLGAEMEVVDSSEDCHLDFEFAQAAISDIPGYGTRFDFDPNNYNMANGDEFILQNSIDDSSNKRFFIELRQNGGQYEIRSGCKDDAAATQYGVWQVISDGPHTIEFQCTYASDTDAGDGQMVLYIDDMETPADTKGSLDHFDTSKRMIRVFLGMDQATSALNTGDLYFDNWLCWINTNQRIGKYKRR